MVELKWLPTPHMSFSLRCTLLDVPAMFASPLFSHVPVQLEVRGHVVKAKLFFKMKDPDWVHGIFLDALRIGSDADAYCVLFHVTNFPILQDGEVVYSTNSHGKKLMWPGRTLLEAEGWHVTLDERPDGHKIEDSILYEAGIAITHVARVQRGDGSAIRSRDADEFADFLNHFLSFLRGGWSSAELAVGLDKTGNRVWEIWEAGKTTPGEMTGPWMAPVARSAFPDLFRTFAARWKSPLWHKPLKLATLYYVEAQSAPSGIEIAGTNIQMGIEVLSWMWAVEHKKAVSGSKFEKKTAADRIRWMLNDCCHTPAIPTRLKELHRLAIKESWQDGPEAITKIRNKLEHPKRTNIEILDAMPADARGQAYVLGLLYFDLAFLRVLEYQGKYANKLLWDGRESFPPTVPWARNR